jgi:hypothetical protein
MDEQGRIFTTERAARNFAVTEAVYTHRAHTIWASADRFFVVRSEHGCPSPGARMVGTVRATTGEWISGVCPTCTSYMVDGRCLSGHVAP